MVTASKLYYDVTLNIALESMDRPGFEMIRGVTAKNHSIFVFLLLSDTHMADQQLLLWGPNVHLIDLRLSPLIACCPLGLLGSWEMLRSLRTLAR